ncbi:MAG: hypothetical protein I4N51_06755, partial [Acinetobacter sp.]|nr:hypothetical protein [Acinetobacter sp.]
MVISSHLNGWLFLCHQGYTYQKIQVFFVTIIYNRKIRKITLRLIQAIPMPDTLTKLTYQTFQQGKNYFGLAHKILSAQLMNTISPSERKSKPIPTSVLLKIQQRLNDLLETDWQDAQKGLYPQSLLFDIPWSDFFLYYPVVWLDQPQIWERFTQKKYQDFSPEIDTSGYPSYYVQNFHHQTDGYLSDRSASLY